MGLWTTRIFGLLIFYCVLLPCSESMDKPETQKSLPSSGLIVSGPGRHIDPNLKDRMINHVLKTIGAGVTAFVCVVCHKQFARACALGRHYSASGNNCTGGAVNDTTSMPVKVTRKSYTFFEKRNALMFYDELIRAGCYKPLAVLRHRTGRPESTLRDWIENRGEIFYMAGKSEYSNLRKKRHVPAQYPEAEFQLYVRFIWRRTYQKRRVGYRWLRTNMRQILRESGIDPLATKFRASNSWCVGFCKRFEITKQCRTNKKTRSIKDRLEQIQGFHRFLIYGLQRSEPERCSKYGRFPPSRMFHMDQVPLPFSPNSRSTLNLKGKQCVIAEPAGDGGKRFATLQVTICANPNQAPINLEVYFRGSGKRLSLEELNFYENLPNVNVRFQPKAWADERICMDYLRYFREATARLNLGEVLLGMDNHGSQATPLCRSFMKNMGIVPAYTPANCTDCISPVDANIGVTIKNIIARKYEEEFDVNEDEWLLPKKEGGLGNKKKRMLVAKWASEAWAEFTDGTKYNHTVTSAFVKTGFLVAKDGSENHLIELHETEMPAGEYDF